MGNGGGRVETVLSNAEGTECDTDWKALFTRHTWSILCAALYHAVTPYKRLGKISDILHLNNENNQLERRAWPPKDVPLDAQSWTRAYDLSSRVVAVTTTTETS